MRTYIVFLIAVLLLAPTWAAGGDVVLIHATLHTVSGPVVHDGTLVVHDGRIVYAGPSEAEAGGIDIHGQDVYPSLLEPDTTLGLVEIEGVRATHDEREVGPLNPDLRADIAFNPDSELLPVAMSSGILVAGVAPRGGLISGRSAVMMLKGWTREDMAVLTPAALYVNWPSMSMNRDPEAKPPVKEQERKLREKIRQLKEAFANSQAYLQARSASGVPTPEEDIQWEAMAPFVKGEKPVVVAAERLDEIEAALAWAQEEKLKMVLLGGADAWRCADKLARAHVGVIYTHLTSIPYRDFDGYDVCYRAPAALARAGVSVALSSGGESARVRDLRDLAGRAVAYGLSPDLALRAITLTPAELLGVSSRLGSLEPGKDATFFVSNGDMLDPRTRVLRAWLQGREIDLSQDRQKRLYEKYRNRPPR